MRYLIHIYVVNLKHVAPSTKKYFTSIFQLYKQKRKHKINLNNIKKKRRKGKDNPLNKTSTKTGDKYNRFRTYKFTVMIFLSEDKLH